MTRRHDHTAGHTIETTDVQERVLAELRGGLRPGLPVKCFDRTLVLYAGGDQYVIGPDGAVSSFSDGRITHRVEAPARYTLAAGTNVEMLAIQVMAETGLDARGALKRIADDNGAGWPTSFELLARQLAA